MGVGPHSRGVAVVAVQHVNQAPGAGAQLQHLGARAKVPHRRKLLAWTREEEDENTDSGLNDGDDEEEQEIMMMR